jgi:L-fuconolactonase
MLLDAHHHLWDDEDLPFEWMTGVRAGLAEQRLPVDYREVAHSAGLEGSVLVEAGEPAQPGRKLLRWADDDARILGVVVAVPDGGLLSPRLPDYLDRLADCPGGQRLVGVRWSGRSVLGPAWLLEESVQRALDTLARRRLALDVIVFGAELSPLASAMRLRDDVEVVLDHLAKPPLSKGEWSEDAGAWESGIEGLADTPSVSLKVSGLVHRAPDDEATVSARIRHVLSVVGARRLMFGSDWPVCTVSADLEETVRRSRRALGPITRTQHDLIAGRTVARVYRLPVDDQ